MKTTTLQAAIGSAILLLATQPCYASSGHQHHHQHRQLHELHHQHHQHHASKRESFNPSNATANPLYESRRSGKLQARGGAKCEFPTTKGLFAVTPNSLNGGWALAPDQDCVDGTWCPIACPAGQVMAQWKPGTTYTYPESTYGGIYCDNGKIDVPFEDKPWCIDGTGTVDAVNKAGSVVSFCQTVLPGYEDMIIPTDVYDSATLAVPDSSYWDSTASHFYINAPGVSSDEGCHWGDDSKPIGNWAPFVAGANTDGSGNTFVKLGLNPVWQDSALYSTKPTFGLKIECDGDCNGLPCEMDGNGVISNEKATGAGGADFCVVTVPKGGKANIIVYNLDGSDGGDSGDDDSDATTSSAEATSTPTSTSTPTPTTTSTPTSTSISTTSAPSTTSTPISTSTSASTSSSSNVQTTISASRSSVISSYPVPSSSTTTSHFLGAVYHQNDTASATDSSSNPATTSVPAGSTSESASGSGSGSESESSPAESSHSENAGKRQDGAAVAGLIIAFVAAVYLL